MTALKLAPAVAVSDPRSLHPGGKTFVETGSSAVAVPVVAGADDALLNAVIWKLPPIGAPFSARARQKWLDMIAMAFDVAYGPADEAVERAAGPDIEAHLHYDNAGAAVTPRPPHEVNGSDFYVDLDGFVRCNVRRDEHGRPFPTPGRRVLGEEVADSGPIYDYRGAARNRETVIWADDSVGALPGMSFCGPG